MKEKINKKQLLLALTAVCLVGLIGVGISYAYYVANFQVKNPENGNNNVTSASTTNVVMDIKSKTVAFDGVLPGHKEVKSFTIRGEGDTNAQPTEAVIKVMPNLGVFSNDVTWKLYKSTEEVTCTSTQKHVNGQYYEDSSCNIPSSATLELSGGALEDFKNITVHSKTETKYYLVVEYANQGNQNDQQGKSYTINLDLGGKGVSPTLVEKITKLAQTDTVNLASDDPDNNIRYIGANPDNYVYFNCSDYNNQSDSTCEKWRIIGLFNNITKSDGSKENLIKIIRDDSLGDIVWDINEINDWTTATLQQNLNDGDYYNTTLKNDNTRNAIENVVWNLGGTASYNSSSNGLASHWYGYERGTTVYSGRPTTWTGKIGLMYPSDYGYATSGGQTSDRATCLAKELYRWSSSSLSDCKNNDYLFKSSSQWTLAPHSSETYLAFVVNWRGSVDCDSPHYDRVVRPALFLKSSISISGGTGSSTESYQLKVN